MTHNLIVSIFVVRMLCNISNIKKVIELSFVGGWASEFSISFSKSLVLGGADCFLPPPSLSEEL